jgi:hypothetical protein
LKQPVKLEFELTPLKQDLINYESEIRKIFPLEIEATEAFSNVTEKNFKDDFTLKNALISKVIPIYSDFADKLGKISPQTVELKNRGICLTPLMPGGKIVLHGGLSKNIA